MARLPQAIREELNRRLDDGGPGGALLSWLNGLSPETKQPAGSPDGLARNDRFAEESARWMEEIFGLASDPGVAGAAEAEESKLVAPGRGEKNLREPGRNCEVDGAMDMGDRQESEMFASAPRRFGDGADRVRSGADWTRFEADKGGLGQLRGKSGRVQPGPSEIFSWGTRGDEEWNVNGVIGNVGGGEPDGRIRSTRGFGGLRAQALAV